MIIYFKLIWVKSKCTWKTKDIEFSSSCVYLVSEHFVCFIDDVFQKMLVIFQKKKNIFYKTIFFSYVWYEP